MNKEAILKVYEPAARIYCARVGVDPDVMVPGEGGAILAAPQLVPVWHGVAFDLYDFSLKITALREASGQKPPANH